MKNKIVYYHEQCRDGFVSAYNMKAILESDMEAPNQPINYIPINYNDLSVFKKPENKFDPQLVTEFYFVDFVPSIEMIDPLIKLYSTEENPPKIFISIHDHHTDNINKFIASLIQVNSEKYFGKMSLRDWHHNAIETTRTLLTREGNYRTVDNADKLPDIEELEIRDFRWITPNDEIVNLTFRLVISTNNVFSGATLTMLSWFMNEVQCAKIMDFVAHTFPYENRKLQINKIITDDPVLVNFVKLAIHVSDGDLYNWKFEGSEEFLAALNDEIVKREFEFDSCCQFLDELINDDAKMEELYEVGRKKVGPMNDFVSLKASPVGWLQPIYIPGAKFDATASLDTGLDLPNRVPIYVIDKSLVSKLSHLVTNTRATYKTVCIISSYNEEKHTYNARIGSSDGSALPLAISLGGGGHPNASGCELNANMFSESENKVIGMLLKANKWNPSN